MSRRAFFTALFRLLRLPALPGDFTSHPPPRPGTSVLMLARGACRASLSLHTFAGVQASVAGTLGSGGPSLPELGRATDEGSPGAAVTVEHDSEDAVLSAVADAVIRFAAPLDSGAVLADM